MVGYFIFTNGHVLAEIILDYIADQGALVNWFTKKKIFEQGDHFATIMERIQARKKKIQVERPDAWDNRLLAKGKTWQEFEAKVKKE